MKADFKISTSLSIQESVKKTPTISRSIDVVVPQKYSYRISSNPRKKKYNRFIHGDNLEAMQQLLSEGYAKKFDLIYIDPPYFSQKNYSHVSKSTGGKTFRRVVYLDKWENIEEYLEMLYPRLLLMKKLLKDNGSIFVHLDWHIIHYVKILLDEIFGIGNFRNEIAWCYYGPSSPTSRQFNREHQNILWYTKSSKKWRFYQENIRIPYKKSTLQKVNSRKNGFKGSIHDFSKGKIPEDWWMDIPIVQRYRYEHAGFETQKPKKLLERIIKATTKKGDLVGDFFVGSGTTAVISQELERRFVVTDNSSISLKLTKTRLLESIQKPFLIESYHARKKTQGSTVN